MIENNQEENTGNTKQWLQDNLRIIISIVIVIAIAGGIYSYSKRSQETAIDSNEKTEEISVSEDILSGGETGEEQVATSEEAGEVATDEGTATSEEEKTEPVSEVSPETTSSETESSFIETAGKGNGVTHLARRALANYLEKNPDSELLPEHKIYIEDYMRKKVGFKGGVRVGTSVEFSKDLVKEAIEKSKGLNEAQIKNLHKYVVLVPSLS